ncbi:hypothetical protein BASA81_001197 [Batrachochytrium salamandrivorans]|nr:hypothetical protein BASA81_001197 [Batrachochytrium salamandrivorans]
MSGFGENPKKPQAYAGSAAAMHTSPPSKDSSFSDQPWGKLRYSSPASASVSLLPSNLPKAKHYPSSANSDHISSSSPPLPVAPPPALATAIGRPVLLLGGRTRVTPTPNPALGASVTGDRTTPPPQLTAGGGGGGGVGGNKGTPKSSENPAFSEIMQTLSRLDFGVVGDHGLAHLKLIVAELEAQQRELGGGTDDGSYSSGSREGTPNSRANGSGSREGTPTSFHSRANGSGSSRHKKQDSRDSVTAQLFDHHSYERSILSPQIPSQRSGMGRAGPNEKMFVGTTATTAEVTMVDFCKPQSPKPPSPKLLSDSSQPPSNAIKVPFSKSVPLMATGAVPPPDTSKSKNLELAHHSSAFRSIRHNANVLGENPLAVPL